MEILKTYNAYKHTITATSFSPSLNLSRSLSPLPSSVPLPPGAPEDEMDVLFHGLKEGGVSLIGSKQPQTQDHFRKSFIRRNKNPVINEKAHALRVLQSTLKVRVDPQSSEPLQLSSVRWT